MQQPFTYRGLIGGAYGKGATFDITKVPIIAATQFAMKYYEVNVSEFLEDIEVENVGPLAVVSRVQADLKVAVNTINEIIAIAMARHGQATTTGVLDNRSLHLNGWAEALNDGTTMQWDGNYFTSYGGQSRVSTSAIGSALNSVPYFCGDSVTGAAGQITYNKLEETYQDATIGNVEPDLGVGNKAVYAYIKERMQVQQRFAQEKDPIFGVSGLRFNSAMILKDDYFPSLKYGQSLATGDYSTSSSLTVAGTPASTSNMPSSGTINVGEVFTWFNTNSWKFRLSNSKLYGFGFTGFKPRQDGTSVAGQILASCNLFCVSPRLNKVLFGINS